MKKICFKLPTIKQVQFEVFASEESIPVKGNASAIDEETDKEIEQYIYRELNNGNIWAWCSVEVRATYKGISASDYLGGCSYKDEADFKNEDGYYKDMKEMAFNSLVEELENMQD